MRVLVTGATGYIGGRIVERLLLKGLNVRVLVRDPKKAQARPWADRVEVVQGDLSEPAGLERALQDVDIAYYLVHSMDAGAGFAERDRAAARAFAEAGRELRHVIYLGGILPAPHLADVKSDHLRSRAEVGEILRSALPTTEFRAGPIIGSGSASFEMVRYLTERLPAMVAPRWILNRVQPIAVRDMLDYLVDALDREDALGVIDVGCEPVTFLSLIHI